MKKALVSLLFLSLSLAYAGSSYHVDLYRPTVVNGTQFKAGECKVELHDNKLTFKQGKTTAEATVKVETNAQKFPSTTVGYVGEGPGNELQEIRLGGTTTKLVFEQGTPSVAGSK
jgi:hypothetical protein